MRLLKIFAATGLLALGSAAAAQAPAPAAPADYTQDAAWLCRPGRADACKANLDAIAVDAQGNRTAQPFHAAADPPIDCFYVYPTISHDPGMYSDMTPGPNEEAASARSQVARFASRCRVFAPVYRQITLAGLEQSLQRGAAPDWTIPYQDVRTAWREYLAHDNHGRGVVLIGHSQGSILLTRLIAAEIDGKPEQRLLVSALLAGPYGLVVPTGRDVGGTFKSVPLCRASSQTGCVVAWSSYQEGDTAQHFYGRNPAAGLSAVCVNPASPGGGRGMLEMYTRKPAEAPAGDPPYVEAVGQLSAECVPDARGTVLRVRIEPGRYASLLRGLFASRTLDPAWGLHSLDVSLVQGNLLDLVDAETRAWLARR